ncbi:MAG: hypothetical protein GKR90_04635 [Pseudomonadales bacterium]|nr:hypothetical protein [Pseudomonadales bacterium]
MHRLKAHITDAPKPGMEIQNLDVCVALCLESESESIVLRIQANQIDFCENDPDWTIYFASEMTALALLSGQANPIEQFMAGELRSSGYIVTTFRVLQALTVLDP